MNWRLKKLRRRGIEEKNTSSTTVKAQQIKELLFAKKTQATKNVMGEQKDKWAKKRCEQELYRLKPLPKRGTIKLHYGLSKELSLLVVQMQTEKIGFWEFFFYCKVLRIVDGRYKYRQKNQTVKYIFLKYRLFAYQQRNLQIEEAKKARKEEGKSLDIECILTNGPCTKKVAIFIKKTGLIGRSMAPLIEDN